MEDPLYPVPILQAQSPTTFCSSCVCLRSAVERFDPYLAKNRPVRRVVLDVQPEGMHVAHVGGQPALGHSRGVLEAADHVESIHGTRKRPQHRLVVKLHLDGGVVELVVGVLEVPATKQKPLYPDGRRESECDVVPLLGQQGPEESGTQVGPGDVVVLVRLERRGHHRSRVGVPNVQSHFAEVPIFFFRAFWLGLAWLHFCFSILAH